MTLIDGTRLAVSPAAWSSQPARTGEDVPAGELEAAFQRHHRELHVHCYRMLGSFTDAEDAVPLAVARETVELAFITAIQALPPRQRAVVALCLALGWSPSETAAALELSTAAVNSALQRARATLRDRLPGDRSDWTSPELSAGERDVLRQFIEVHERGDAAAALALMRDDWMTTMPPDPHSRHGLEEAERLLRIAFGPDGLGEWRTVRAPANRQPATASYLRRPGDGRYHIFKIDVMRVVDGKVAETVVFDGRLIAAFGLPAILPEDWR